MAAQASGAAQLVADDQVLFEPGEDSSATGANLPLSLVVFPSLGQEPTQPIDEPTRASVEHRRVEPRDVTGGRDIARELLPIAFEQCKRELSR